MNKELINKIIDKAIQYNIKKLYLFGSAAESENFRDIDLACEGLLGWDLFRFAGDLELEISKNVDVIDLDNESLFTKAIRPKLKLLYEKR